MNIVQHAAVFRLKGALRPRQVRAHRIVHQVEVQSAVRHTERFLVQRPDRLNHRCESTVTSLAVGPFCVVIGQRTDEFDPVGGKDIHEMPVRRFKQHHQVAADDQPLFQRGKFADQPLQVRMHFRGASGDVDRRDLFSAGRLDAVHHRFPAHHLRALRAGLHMAVLAGQIALPGDVHLEDIDAGGPKRKNAAIVQAFDKWI